MRLEPARRVSILEHLERHRIRKRDEWRWMPTALCLMFLTLTCPHQSSADEPRFLISGEAIDQIAELLIKESADVDMFDEPCRLWLSDREGMMGTLIAGQSYADLQKALSEEFQRIQPDRECEISILDTVGRPAIDQIIQDRETNGLPGSLLALRIFQTVGGIKIIADGYRGDGTFVMHTSGIDVALVDAEPAGESSRATDRSDDLPTEPPAASPSNQAEDPAPQADDAEKSFLESLRKRRGTELAD